MVVWHCLSCAEAVHWSGNGRQSRFLFFMLGKRKRRAREQYFLWGYALTDLKPFIGSDSLKLSTMFQCCHTKDQTLAYGPLETIPDPKYNTQDVCICFYLTLTIQICSPFPELGLSVGPSQHPSHLWSPEHRLGGERTILWTQGYRISMRQGSNRMSRKVCATLDASNHKTCLFSKPLFSVWTWWRLQSCSIFSAREDKLWNIFVQMSKKQMLHIA